MAVSPQAALPLPARGDRPENGVQSARKVASADLGVGGVVLLEAGAAREGRAMADAPSVLAGADRPEHGIQAAGKADSADLGAGGGVASLETGAARGHPRLSSKRPANRERERVVRRRRDGDQSLRRFGDKSSVHNSVLRRVPSYETDNEMSYTDSFEHSLSSSDKENVKPGRKRFLDDALFEFFRKEAIKSMKSEFSKFCNESDVCSKSKLVKEVVINRYDFSSYSIKYFWEVLKSLSNRRKEVIGNFGFSCLLLFQKCEVPSAFVRWIASCVDPVSSQILVDDCKIISISKESMYRVTGLPNSGNVPSPNSERGAKFILSFFGLTDLPHITFFGNKLKSKEVLSDKEIFVCFIVIAFKCFLFPSSDEYPNTDFLHILEEPESARNVDICLLVYEHILSGVLKFSRTCKLNGRKPKDFEFCYYILGVYYLDSLDFGARLIDQSVHRISVWNGNMIKFYSELDHRKKNIFGKRQLKKNLPRCYREFGPQEESVNDVANEPSVPRCFSSGFKDKLHIRFGNALDAKIIDGIIDSVQAAAFANVDKSSKFELSVNNVLQFLIGVKSCEFKVLLAETNAPDI